MSSSPIVLGINAYHADAAACIVRDGFLVAAAEEERFRRIKHWAGFPSRAIAYCLQEAKVELSDVTHVAVNRNARANFVPKLTYVVAKRPSPALLLSKLRNRKKVASIADELNAIGPRPFTGTIEYVEHHLAHLASAFYPSPFREAAVVSVDGFGDFAGFDAARADAEALGGAINERFDDLQVDVPAATGDVVGVRDVIAEARTFAANIASLCHGSTPDS